MDQRKARPTIASGTTQDDLELRRLVELCRFAVHPDRTTATPKSVDWDRLVGLARRHRVQGLTWLGVSHHEGAPPPPQAADLLEDSKLIARQNLIAVHASAELLDAFRKSGLPILFLKGLTLGALVYSQPLFKQSADIDILIRPTDLTAAVQRLRDLGYQVEADVRAADDLEAWHGRNKESSWVRQDGVMLDLHTRLADNPRLIPNLTAQSPCQEVQVAPAVVLPTLAPEELFAYLSVHGASSAWFRLKWITDFAALLNRYSEAEIGELHDAAQRLGAGRCPEQALLLAEMLYGPLVPLELLERSSREMITRWTARLSLGQLSHSSAPLDRRLGTMTIHLNQLLMGRGSQWYRRELGRQVSNLLQR